jgi:hypothetical protein
MTEIISPIPLQDTTAQYPLPPRKDDNPMGTPEMFKHLEPYVYQGIPGFEELGGMAPLNISDLAKMPIGGHAFRIVDHAEPRPPTPWHFHHLDLHLSVITKGWVHLDVEGAGEKVVKAGQLLCLPARIRHRELGEAPGTEGFEIVSPGPYKTTFFVFNEETESYDEVDVWL